MYPAELEVVVGPLWLETGALAFGLPEDPPLEVLGPVCPVDPEGPDGPAGPGGPLGPLR